MANYELNYPGAKKALDYIEERLQNQNTQYEIDNLFKKRELQLQQSKITSEDMARDRDSQTAANQANAKLLSALKSKE